MHDFPQQYVVTASGTADGEIDVTSGSLAVLHAAPPIEFDGPGDLWSPESLLVAAVSGCFILTFRAVARASKLAWTSLDCETRGTLDRPDRATQFTRFDIRAHLTVAAGTDGDRARLVLEKAERACLITSSLKGERHLNVEIGVARRAGEPVPA